MNSRKEITDPKGHPYTHYDWVNANFTKYFGKSKAKKNPTLGTLNSPPPDKSGDVYDTPMEMGWARIRNGRVSLDVEVNIKKLNRSQKKVIRDIVDTNHKRPLYIDIWKKNKTSRAGDLGFDNYDDIVDFLSEVYKDSGLGKWFGQSAGGDPGWDRYNTKGDRVGKCGDSKPGEGKPKCLSPEKARKLRAQGGKKAIGNAAKRKKAQDPDTDRPGTGNKPINVSNKIKKEETMKSFSTYLQEKNKPTNPKLWASSIAAAKSKFDVYPSAYANAWASKNYKSKGGGWVKESMAVDYKQNRRMGVEPKDAYQRAKGKRDRTTTDSPKTMSVKQKRKDDERSALLARTFDQDRKAGYSTESFRNFRSTNEASAAWQRKEGKNKEGGLNAKGRASYERENPGSDLKAPVSSKTASKNPDGKAAKRRKSFCARMGGMPGAMKKPNGEPTRKALALRKWDC
jgi:hypothetical protein